MINKEIFHQYYLEIFNKNGLAEFCDDATIDKMFAMSERLLEVNEHMNLTAITEVPEVIAKHLADSVVAAKYLPQGSTVCDVGCGGGFPSLPLAIARPDLTILGIDSTEKRVRYVSESAVLLNLHNLTAVAGRAEELARTDLRESFDVCIARAVAALPILSELCIPFVKRGGIFVAMKGRLSDDEITSASQKLGCEAIATQNALRYQIKTTNSDEERCIVVIKKIKSTPTIYPRTYSQIKKKPLI